VSILITAFCPALTAPVSPNPTIWDDKWGIEGSQTDSVTKILTGPALPACRPGKAGKGRFRFPSRPQFFDREIRETRDVFFYLKRSSFTRIIRKEKK
jgi:hypothetical protein